MKASNKAHPRGLTAIAPPIKIPERIR